MVIMGYGIIVAAMKFMENSRFVKYFKRLEQFASQGFIM